MKKWLILAVAIILVVLLTVGVFLCIRFVAIYRETQETEATEEQYSVEEYAAQKLPEFAREYDRKTNTLTLSRVSALSYEDACSFGGNIYVDEVLFKSSINPYRKSSSITLEECNKIIINSRR